MRYVTQLLFLFAIGSTVWAQDQVSSFMKDILDEIPSVRDLSLGKNEAFFTAQSPLGEISVIMVTRKVLSKWRKPKIVSFSGTYKDLEPFLSPDGKRLYFASNRPLSDGSETKDFDLWVVEREHSKGPWSDPINLGGEVNTEYNEFYPSLTTSGSLYFTSDRPDSSGGDNIFYSTQTNGVFSTPVSLGDSVNSDGYDFNAYIALDESYLIFSGYNRPDGLGSGDLYISFKMSDNTWTEAKNMGARINSAQMDYCPYVDEANQTLYFTSRRSDVTFKSGGFKNANEFLREANKSKNGQSRLYQTAFKDQQ